uniref:Protein inscuteable homologue C-terminal domain-containing protein n=1 Tax=Anopheles dirus TaxID=7168 RepID=A0A182NAL1_9DIPT
MSRSNFARSQSKVWFGNEPDCGPYGGFRPYGYHLHSGPMSRPTYPAFHDLEEEDELIEEQQAGDKNAATGANSWAETNRQGSPASHKSQVREIDSGFSDTETSLNAGGSLAKRNNINDSQSSSGTTDKLTPKRSVNEELFTRSPSLNSSAPTPPTVIRRPAPVPARTGQELGRRLSYSEPTETQTGSESPRSVSLKRGRVITKNSRVKRNLSDQLSNSSEEMISLDSSELTSILNRSVREGTLSEPVSEPDANNNHTIKGCEAGELPTYADLYPTRGTSTPIRGQSKLYRSLPLSPTQRAPPPIRPVVAPSGTENFYEEPNTTIDTVSDHALSYTIYDNPLLNGHQPAVQGWLDGLRFSCQSEVMSILQTKSIATEAGRSLRLTSTVAVKILRHLQGKVSTLQGSFERVEKLFAAIRKYQAQQEHNDAEEDEEDEKEIYQKVAPFVHGLATDIDAFVQKQQGTDYFGREASEREDRRKFAENARALADMTADLRAAASSTDTFDYRSAEEEVQIVKRYFLITVRLIFKNLVRVIVDAVEGARCELILRSNLSYVASLSNLDYGGLASLNDAFIANGTVRVLLLVCVESKLSSVRALALRALATVCSTTETIRQLERADGLEVLRDILATGTDAERTEPELREAVSVLTQITAPWHGEEHRLEGLKQFVHAIVEAITEIVERTNCCQTLLLCTAGLNNMTRIEPTAVYALMSQDTVGKLRTATEHRGPGASIFLYEQFTAMLYNMSANWKCHHHLAGRPLLAFLVTVLSQKFHERLASRVESEAQRKTIRNILHVLSRLLTGGSLSSGASLELIETTIGPVLARIERTLDGGSEHYQDVSFVSRRCNESLATRPTTNGEGTDQSAVHPHEQQQPHITRLTIRRDPVAGPVMVLDQNRQESYV